MCKFGHWPPPPSPGRGGNTAVISSDWPPAMASSLSSHTKLHLNWLVQTYTENIVVMLLMETLHSSELCLF